MLVFLYMAGMSYGILEKDILLAAQTDSIGYLTLYRNYHDLAKANYLLRPINVPFKNKWLRDTASTLHFSDSLPISSPITDTYTLLQRASKDLNLPD